MIERSGRKKVLKISESLTRLDWITILRSLPEDATIVAAKSKVNEGQIWMLVRSESYEETAVGQEYPTLDISLTVADRDREAALDKQRSGFIPGANDTHMTVDAVRSPVTVSLPKQQGECICDMAYTGLRAHKKECSLR